ncbi:pth11-type gpcr protein [Diplodia corticola]|uniref:Pth11-type gpcr protein n=1 Tax=Diplodia corticola TaxID=236234 RepID=A0A1J9QLD7_9PEZI|nr:pth11-type gpcr protein [Diplodia corticola]OJD29710.1 pth11-type gpcr protein [Diplodia corticola]
MDDPTLLILWLLTWLAVTIMVSRLLLRKVRGQDYSAGDYLTMAAIFCAFVRLALIHVVLVWGTNNMSPQLRDKTHWTPEKVYRREIGSKFAVVNRVFYNSYLWLQKLVLLDITRQLIKGLHWEYAVLRFYLFIFGGTYVAVQVVTFTECTPFHLYWQVLPDPGSCSQAQTQLVAVGILNILTDIMLMILPIPIFFYYWKRPLLQRIHIFSLFCLGIFIVAITAIRLPQNYNQATSQVNRTTWASIELFVVALAVNAPVLYTLRKRQLRPQQPPPATVIELSDGPASDSPMVQDLEARNEYYNRTRVDTAMVPDTPKLKR